jgi:hypothetical protein
MSKVAKVAIVVVGVAVGVAIAPLAIKAGKKAWSWYRANYLTMPEAIQHLKNAQTIK